MYLPFDLTEKTLMNELAFRCSNVKISSRRSPMFFFSAVVLFFLVWQIFRMPTESVPTNLCASWKSFVVQRPEYRT